MSYLFYLYYGFLVILQTENFLNVFEFSQRKIKINFFK